MLLRRITSHDYDAVAKLWLERFPEDSAKFVRWYFEQVFETGWGYFDGNELLSMAFAKSVEIVEDPQYLKTHKGIFIQAVATAKSVEGHGYSSMLLTHLFDEAGAAGVEVAVLQTFIPDFYKRLGFSAYAYHLARSHFEYSCMPKGYTLNMINQPVISSSIISEMLNCYHHGLSGYTGWNRRSMHQMQTMLYEEIVFGRRALILAYRDNQLSAYAIGSVSQNCFEAEELVASTPEGKQAILSIAPTSTLLEPSGQGALCAMIKPLQHTNPASIQTMSGAGVLLERW